MKERPILFTSYMVRAILDGRKTETRRVIKTQPPTKWDRCHPIQTKAGGVIAWDFYNSGDHYDHGYLKKTAPYYQAQERLWVREKFAHMSVTSDSTSEWIVYEDGWRKTIYKGEMIAPGCEKYFSRHEWQRPRSMPRWASRIILEVTEVKVERLLDIDRAGAVAEGVDWEKCPTVPVLYDDSKGSHSTNVIQYVAGFKKLWDSIYKERGYSWESNPWVWVVKFKVIEKRGE